MSVMRLKAARELAGLSQSALAKQAGLQPSAVYDIEAGRNARPAHELVVKVVRALQRAGLAGITPEQICEFTVPDDTAETVDEQRESQPETTSERARS